MFDPTALRIHCPTCHGALTVQCEPEGPVGPAVGLDVPLVRTEHQGDLGARVIWVLFIAHLPVRRPRHSAVILLYSHLVKQTATKAATIMDAILIR